MRFTAAAAALASLLAAGCASVRPTAAPTHVDHGMLLVRARVRGAIVPFTSDEPDQASVEQIDADGYPIPGKTAVSRLSHEGSVYFLDLPPGRYALAGLSFRARLARYEVELSSAAMRRNTVELRPGTAAFLGDLSLDGRFPDFDVAVERAITVVGHWLLPVLRRPVIPRDADLRSHDVDRKSERAVLLAAREPLAGTQWRGMVEARLREIGAPEPAPTTGVVRSREVPLQETTFFSWRDTLKWGPPAKVGTGLAWRKPGGEARVAVFFTSATVQGFVGYEEAVRQMRAAVDALEDRAALYEVRVGTRTGTASRLTSHSYPEGTLTGSETKVVLTETVLVEDPNGMYTARLRAPRGEFEKVLPSFREFLLQLVLGQPVHAAPKEEAELPPL